MENIINNYILQRQVENTRLLELEALAELTEDERTEYWRLWNISDHERAYRDGYPCVEVKLYSPIMMPQMMPEDGPPLLVLHQTVNSKKWAELQLANAFVQYGEIVYILNARTADPNIMVTYAMMRVNTPNRWINYCIYHSPIELFIDVIRNSHQG